MKEHNKKVLFYTHGLPPFLGGTYISTHDMIYGINEYININNLSIDISVVAPYISDKNFDEKNIKFNINRTKFIKRKVKNIFYIITPLFMVLYLLKTKPDFLVLCGSMERRVFSLIPSFMYKSKIISIVSVPYIGMNIKDKIFRFQENIILNKSYKIICISKSTNNIIKNRGYKNTTVIYRAIKEGMDITNINKKKNDDCIKFLYLGRIELEKGIDIFIGSLKKIKDQKIFPFRFTIIGEGGDRLKIENIIKSYNLEKDILIIDKVNNTEIGKYFEQHDMTIFISRRKSESLGRVTAESLLHNTPVLIANTGGMKEVVPENYLLIINNPNNPEEVLSKIIEWYGINNKERELIINEAQEFVINRFHPLKIGKQWCELFQEI